MTTQTITIPFAQLRALAPADGRPFVVWTGKRNKWRENRERFMRHESLEVALGRGIRAEPGNRDDEVSMSPGLRCRDGYIHVRGGWRLHKAVRAHNDFFDGLISFKLVPTVDNGRIDFSVRDLDLSWNANLVARIVDFLGLIRGTILRVLRKIVADKIEDGLEEAIEEKIEEAIQLNPQLGYLLDITAIRLVRDAVKITLEFSTEPDAEDDDDRNA